MCLSGCRRADLSIQPFGSFIHLQGAPSRQGGESDRAVFRGAASVQQPAHPFLPLSNKNSSDFQHLQRIYFNLRLSSLLMM